MGKLIWITGLAGSGKTTIARKLYSKLKEKMQCVVHFDGDDVRHILGDVYGHNIKDRITTAYIYSRLCSFLTSQGITVIMSTISLFHEIQDYNSKNNEEYYEILLDVSKDELLRRNQKKLYTHVRKNVMGMDLKPEFPKEPALILPNNNINELEENIKRITELILK